MTESVTIEGIEYPDPSTAQRLIAKLDQDHYPAGGYESRARIIAREIVPLDKALTGVELTPQDVGLIAWLVKSGEGIEVAALITKIRRAQSLITRMAVAP